MQFFNRGVCAKFSCSDAKRGTFLPDVLEHRLAEETQTLRRSMSAKGRHTVLGCVRAAMVVIGQ